MDTAVAFLKKAGRRPARSFRCLSGSLATFLVAVSVGMAQDHASDLAVLRKLEPVFDIEQGIRIQQRKWVELHVGAAIENEVARGWLLEGTAGSVRILGEEGGAQAIRRPGKDEKRPDGKSDAPSAVWEMKIGDFPAHCRSLLKKSDAIHAEFENSFSGYRFAQEVVGKARLACWAMQRGDRALAADLLKCAETSIKASNKFMNAKHDLFAVVTTNLAQRKRSAAIDSAVGESSRADLLAAWEKVASIPQQEREKEAKAMAAHYRSLIAEDKAWRQPADLDVTALAVEQKVAYWMHHLRDLNVVQMSQPGFCHVVGGFGAFARNGGPNPAEELVKLGTGAIPALIAHMDDERPTRSLAYWRMFAPESFYLLRYGDCCQQVFHEITGHTLPGHYPIQDGKGKVCKERAEKWWRDYQQFGEEGMQKRGIEAGDRDSPGLAEKLIAKNPEAALAAIPVGLRRFHDEWGRDSLVRTMRSLEPTGATPILLEELAGPNRSSRIEAGSILAEWKHPLGIAALLKEWRTPPSSERFGEWHANENLLASLLGTQDPATIRALGSDWSNRSVSDRNSLIDQMQRVKTTDAAADRAIDDILIAALDDTERTGWTSTTFGNGKSRTLD